DQGPQCRLTQARDPGSINRRTTMRLLRLAMALTAVALAAAPASAQEFPTRPINLIVAFPAGGSTDIGARVLAGISEKMIGQPIVVVNKGGAGGQVGWTELARAKPD